MLSLLSSVYNLLLVSPLRRLYLYGPAAYNVGFWEGKEASEMCQVMTNHNQLFWENNHEECQTLIETRFQSFKTTVEVVLYFTLMYKIVVAVLTGCSLSRMMGFFDNCNSADCCSEQIIYVPVMQKRNPRVSTHADST